MTISELGNLKPTLDICNIDLDSAEVRTWVKPTDKAVVEAVGEHLSWLTKQESDLNAELDTAQMQKCYTDIAGIATRLEEVKSKMQGVKVDYGWQETGKAVQEDGTRGLKKVEELKAVEEFDAKKCRDRAVELLGKIAEKLAHVLTIKDIFGKGVQEHPEKWDPGQRVIIPESFGEFQWVSKFRGDVERMMDDNDDLEITDRKGNSFFAWIAVHFSAGSEVPSDARDRWRWLSFLTNSMGGHGTLSLSTRDGQELLTRVFAYQYATSATGKADSAGEKKALFWSKIGDKIADSNWAVK